jgi:hypothetical protein
MRDFKLTLALAVFTFVTPVSSARSQQASGGRTAQASLTVTVVVESSVSLVPGQDGEQQLIVANVPDPRETFSSRTALKKDAGGSVMYAFPGKPFHAEVTRETQMLKLNGAKAGRQPVTVVTVVPQ